MNCINREMFVASLTDLPEDKFAKTFVAKADAMKLWETCIGYTNDQNKVKAAIITTFGEKSKIANLQLLHTFATYRKKGLAKELVIEDYSKANFLGCKYFRVSSEPDSVDFYKKLGFKFQGKQKSGCFLSFGKLVPGIMPCDSYYGLDDPIINSKVNSKAKGGCVEIFEEFKNYGVDQWTTE